MQISAQVGAAIVDVPVNDNQLVEAGAELVRLDDRDYIAQRDQAQATVDNLSGANRRAAGARSIKPTSRSRKRKPR